MLIWEGNKLREEKVYTKNQLVRYRAQRHLAVVVDYLVFVH